MADEELISEAIFNVFKKPLKLIVSEHYTIMKHEMRVEDSDTVKVNLTLKRGLVIEIEEDSAFRAFLSVGDILLVVNEKVVAKSDFKLTDLFRDKSNKAINFTYMRLRTYSSDSVPFDDEKREGYDYRVANLYFFHKTQMGLVLMNRNSRVMVAEVLPKSVASMCMLVGDTILHVCGRRQTDATKALNAIAVELAERGTIKITIERPISDYEKAKVGYYIGRREMRDPYIPADCVDYMAAALAQLKHSEGKSIMKIPHLMVCTESARVGFHDRMTTESVIPSDIQDETLIKTPARVQIMPQPQPSSNAADTERLEVSAMKSIMPSVHERPTTPLKEPIKKSKAGSKKVPEKKKPLLSKEIFFGRKNRKKSAEAVTKTKKKKNKKSTDTTGLETETP